MENKLKVVGVLALGLVFMGAGCAKVSKDNTQQPVSSSSSPVVEESYQTYVWKDYGITFNYPKKIFITYDGFNMLGFSDSPGKEISINGVDINGETLFLEGNLTIDEMVDGYKRYPKYFKSQTTEKIGKYSFTKIEYYNPIVGRVFPHYFLQVSNNHVLEYTFTGIGDATTTLSSLQF